MSASSSAPVEARRVDPVPPTSSDAAGAGGASSSSASASSASWWRRPESESRGNYGAGVPAAGGVSSRRNGRNGRTGRGPGAADDEGPRSPPNKNKGKRTQPPPPPPRRIIPPPPLTPVWKIPATNGGANANGSQAGTTTSLAAILAAEEKEMIDTRNKEEDAANDKKHETATGDKATPSTKKTPTPNALPKTSAWGGPKKIAAGTITAAVTDASTASTTDTNAKRSSTGAAAAASYASMNPQDVLKQVMAQAKKSRTEVGTGVVRCLSCGKPMKSYEALCQHLADSHYGVNSSDPSEVALAAIAAGKGAKLSLSTKRSAQKTLLGDLLDPSSSGGAFPKLGESASKDGKGKGAQKQQQQQQQQQKPTDVRAALLSYAKTGGASKSTNDTAKDLLTLRSEHRRDTSSGAYFKRGGEAMANPNKATNEAIIVRRGKERMSGKGKKKRPTKLKKSVLRTRTPTDFLVATRCLSLTEALVGAYAEMNAHYDSRVKLLDEEREILRKVLDKASASEKKKNRTAAAKPSDIPKTTRPPPTVAVWSGASKHLFGTSSKKKTGQVPVYQEIKDEEVELAFKKPQPAPQLSNSKDESPDKITGETFRLTPGALQASWRIRLAVFNLTYPRLCKKAADCASDLNRAKHKRDVWQTKLDTLVDRARKWILRRRKAEMNDSSADDEKKEQAENEKVEGTTIDVASDHGDDHENGDGEVSDDSDDSDDDDADADGESPESHGNEWLLVDREDAVIVPPFTAQRVFVELKVDAEHNGHVSACLVLQDEKDDALEHREAEGDESEEFSATHPDNTADHLASLHSIPWSDLEFSRPSYHCFVCRKSLSSKSEMDEHLGTRRHARQVARCATELIAAPADALAAVRVAAHALCTPFHVADPVATMLELVGDKDSSVNVTTAAETVAAAAAAADGTGARLVPPTVPRRYVGSAAGTTFTTSICDQAITPELNKTAKEMLQLLLGFQHRLREQCEIKGDMTRYNNKKRMVFGLREVAKWTKSGRAACLVVAPNIERAEGAGGLDDTLETIIDTCRSRGTPVIFCMNRNKLAEAVGKKQSKVSAIAISDVNGADKPYKLCLQLAKDGRESFKKAAADAANAAEQQQQEKQQKKQEEDVFEAPAPAPATAAAASIDSTTASPPRLSLSISAEPFVPRAKS